MPNHELLTTLDYVLIVVYLVGVVVFGSFMARGQKTSDDYFVAGRSMHWFPLALSIWASDQCQFNAGRPRLRLQPGPAVPSYFAGGHPGDDVCSLSGSAAAAIETDLRPHLLDTEKVGVVRLRE